jgi:hypothetical protein
MRERIIMSNGTDAIRTWLEKLEEGRTDSSRGLTTELLESVGNPPIPPKGNAYSELVKYHTPIKFTRLYSTRKSEQAVHDRFAARDTGDFVAVELAENRAMFWEHVGDWFAATYT